MTHSLRARIAELESTQTRRGLHRKLREFSRRMNTAEARVAAMMGDLRGASDNLRWSARKLRDAGMVTAADITDREAGAINVVLSTPPAPVSQAAADVLAERRRQIEGESWTPEHDDEHANSELALAAAAYAYQSALSVSDRERGLRCPFWPARWSLTWFKTTTRRRDLVKAGALIIAEIERLDRAAEREG